MYQFTNPDTDTNFLTEVIKLNEMELIEHILRGLHAAYPMR